MNYSQENLKQRAFILSSFTRLKKTLSTSIYEFVDYTINTGWSPALDNLNKVDEEVLRKYQEYMKNK
jgi:hypothetical protein